MMAEHLVSMKEEEKETVICTAVPAIKSQLICETSMCVNHTQSPEPISLDLSASPENQNGSFYKKVSNSTEDTSCNGGTSTLHGERVEPNPAMVKETVELKDEKKRNFAGKSLLRKMGTLKKTQSLPQCQTHPKETLAAGKKKGTIPFTNIIKQLKNKVLHGISKPEDNIYLSYQIQPLEKKRDKNSRNMSSTEKPTMTDPADILHKSDNKDGDHKTISMDIHQLKKEIDVEKTLNMLLDIKTAGDNVLLTSDFKSALWSVVGQNYPKSRKRFVGPQVLSVKNFSLGKHFWKVETSKSGNWRVGMCYGSMARKGFGSYIGCNNKSWGLCKWNNQFSVMHNCKEIKLSHTLSCQRIGVYLDYEAGQLSFYELCEPIRHLHTFSATFSEPLHAVFRIWLDSLGAGWILLRS